jgi:hypothetical protein
MRWPHIWQTICFGVGGQIMSAGRFVELLPGGKLAHYSSSSPPATGAEIKLLAVSCPSLLPYGAPQPSFVADDRNSIEAAGTMMSMYLTAGRHRRNRKELPARDGYQF